VKQQIGKIYLTEQNGISKVEFEFEEEVNVRSFFNMPETTPPVNLSECLKEWWENSGLPVLTYRRENYSGARTRGSDSNVMYWNFNNRAGYLNISTKADLLNPILKEVTMEDGSIEEILIVPEWLEEAQGIEGCTFTPEMMVISRVAFGVDRDTRFHHTKRVKVHDLHELDAFLKLLLPRATEWLTKKTLNPSL
jgi:hypothetical protein